jgi:hypothetical protein
VKQIIDDQIVVSRPLEGPLRTQIGAFARNAREEGYAVQSRCRRVLLAAGFSGGARVRRADVAAAWSQTPPVTTHPILLRITRPPVGRRASGFVQVAQWLSKMPECRWEAPETFTVTVVSAGA